MAPRPKKVTDEDIELALDEGRMNKCWHSWTGEDDRLQHCGELATHLRYRKEGPVKSADGTVAFKLYWIGYCREHWQPEGLERSFSEAEAAYQDALQTDWLVRASLDEPDKHELIQTIKAEKLR